MSIETDFRNILTFCKPELTKQTSKAATAEEALLRFPNLLMRELDIASAAWLAGVTAAACRFGRYGALMTSEQHFLVAWGTISLRREDNKPSINENRFMRWLNADQLSDFYELTLDMIRILRQEKIVFDLSSLAEVAERRNAWIAQNDDDLPVPERFRYWAVEKLMLGQQQPAKRRS